MKQAIATATIIKKSPARTVVTLKQHGREYIAKIFHAPLLGDKIRAIMRSRATQEWNNLWRLVQLEIAGPRPIALGFLGLEAYLLIEKIPGTQTLKQRCRQPLPFEQRRRITRNLAILVADLHNCGLLHGDLHFGNILLDQEDKLYVVDLHKIKQRRQLAPSDCLMNLALLSGSFAVCAGYLDHLRFWHYYHQHCRIVTATDFYGYARKANACLLQQRRSYWLKKGQRCIKNNKYFHKINVGTASGFAVRDDIRVQQLLQPVDQLIAGAKILKNSRSGLVVQTDYAIVKRYRRKKSRNWFIDCWRSSKAKKAWIAGHQCLVRGIATAAPLLFCERRYARFLLDHWLVSTEIAPAQTLYQYLNTLAANPSPENIARKTNLLWRLGRLIRVLHQRGLSHRDLKVNNLLVDAGEHLYLIDLDGLQAKSKVSDSRRDKDLQRLLRSLRQITSITDADIYRLIAGYYPFGAGNNF